jgi:dienelactone hydrolase
MRFVLLFFWLLSGHAALAQPKPTANVLDWKAPATLSTYLVQEMHRQYEPRPAELLQATTSAANMRRYQDSLRARFRRVLGPLPARTPLKAQVVGRIARPGFRVEKVIYESSPRHHVTANLYVPESKGKKPGVLLLCGHENEAKATVSYQKTALLLATNGFVVLVVDPVSQGERMQLTTASGQPLTRGGTTEHTLLNDASALLDGSLPAGELWDNVRGLDYLLTRAEVDTARIGCLGNSGGATQTAYLMALDPRVKVAALCSYVASGERNLELTGPADGCVQLPGAGQARLDLADWPIMFAPRPLLLLAGRYDFVDYNSIESTYAETRRAYATLGQPAQVGLYTYDDGHGISQPKREQAVQWFRQWLSQDAKPIAEGSLPVLAEKELRCTATGQVSTAYRDEETLPARYRAQGRELATQRPRLAPEVLVAAVRRQLGIAATDENIPVAIERRDTLRLKGFVWQKLILRREGQPPLPALLLLPEGGATPAKLVIGLADRGKASLADSTTLLQDYQRQHAAVLLADLRGLGETADPAAFNDSKYYNREYRPALLSLHLGRPLLAQRVTDVFTLLRFVQDDARLRGLPLEMNASGRAAPVALHAAVLAPQLARLTLAGSLHSFYEILEHPERKDAYSVVLPGVLRYYDLPDLQQMLGSRLTILP